MPIDGVTADGKGKVIKDKGLARKAQEDGDGKRILIVDQELCKPGMEAYVFLSKIAKQCTKECIAVVNKRISIYEEACLACLTRAKNCPGGAVKVVNLPANLTTGCTHHYGLNSFKLHGLPTPRPGSVLGLLGTNGIGKSTALKILSGRLKPNLGNLDDPPGWADVLKYFRGSDLQRYFTRMLEDNLKVALKVQLDTDFVKRLRGKPVREVLETLDERGKWEQFARRLDLLHLLDRDCASLSGGELQRLAICWTVNRQADVYMFDEASSFLDIKQRMQAVDVIRSLVFDEDGGVGAPERYVIVVEHDLAVLDYMSDYICCLYGEPGAWGSVTKIASTGNGINNYLAGYFPAENMRFRNEEISFQVSGNESEDQLSHEGGILRARLGEVRYPGISKTLVNEKTGSQFTLHVTEGTFKGSEMIGLLGENGCGKTTFMEVLAGAIAASTDGDADAADSSLAGLGVAYKRQHYAPRLRRFEGTVRDLFERTIQSMCADRLFRLLVLKPLGMEALEHLYVQNLSGGELQRVAITLCLGQPATVYLLDEPSAGLDCEQRIIASKVIRRWVVNNLQRTAFVIEHDFVMASALSDRVIVYSGEPGVECTAHSPAGLCEGFNTFLQHLDVTFRRDPINLRPRVNKKMSAKDREQKACGSYFVFDVDERERDAAAKEAAAARGKK